MDRPSQICVTKLDAARRQIRTAIELWAADGDPVSIHTLAFAAHQVIHDLNQNENGPKMLLDNPSIPMRKKKEFINIVKKAANFFKHADNSYGSKKNGRKEPEVMEIDFPPEINELLIAITIDGLKHLIKDLSEIEKAFYIWYSIQRPDLFNEARREAYENSVSTEIMNSLRSMKKQEFLEYTTQLHRKT